MPPRKALAPELVASSIITGSQVIRYWGDDPEFVTTHSRIKPGDDGIVDYLTLSGGGINGAYGAGFLVGWTARGDRPEFEVVTGISVGAMMAPLAFIGSRHDGRLQAAFSSLTQQTNMRVDFLSALFGAPSVLKNTVILDAIRQLVDERVLDEVAAGHRQGRRLYVGTTNLDAQRPVVWDIGAIAVSNIPNKLDLVHRIILASTAVPGVFPPVLLEAEAQGQRIDELHVDGGVTQQVLLMPGGYKGGGGTKKLYVLFNGVVDPTPATVTRLASLDLLERAVPTLLKYLGRANLEQLANTAARNNIAFRLSAIPASFPQSQGLLGDEAWLGQLFDFGFANGKAGIWQNTPR
ncbi:patatin-like phospholipase family protein [Devosia honganensis]|uniref:Patatin-like phospholipase family protein n=1 Tax=Devosia honganensis TaxID=1610527 RepID=A0ABV7X175_9HYPH